MASASGRPLADRVDAVLRPLSLLPALVAVVTALAPPVAADPDRPPLLSRSQSRAAPAPAPAAEATPLQVTIDALSPSYVPASGPVRVSGSVTNTSDDPWRSINVYAFAGSTPITSSSQLAEERLLDPVQPVGDRITDPGTFDDVDDLEPGQSTRFSIRVPRSSLGVTEAGVYWFGVHALGEGPSGRDVTADGRARTFLPLVPRPGPALETAVVIPVRHGIRRLADGSIADVEQWASDLDSGPLRALVDFGASAGSRPVTWLVDPAVPEAVQSLVSGNPVRSLANTTGPEPEPPEEPGEAGSTEPGPTAEPVPSESPAPTEGEAEIPATEATEPGEAWMARFREAVAGDQVLALPYGDLDVSASVERDPRFYRWARKRSSGRLEVGDRRTSPAVSSPSGYVDPGAIESLHPRATLLVTDQMFGAEPPAVARVDGHRLVVTSSAADGGPGPGDPLDAVKLRQQILSEAAVRLLSPGRRPLVVLLPPDWSPSSTTGFFDGLDVPWVDLTDVDGLAERAGGTVDRDRLEYPQSQVRRELDAANFSSAAALVEAGETLQNLLTRNDEVAGEVRDEALTGLSHSSRDTPNAARAAADGSRRWIQEQLSSVTVNAPRAVTLSSSTGRFAASVTNGLPYPVTVRLEAVADEPLRIEGPQDIQVAPESTTSVLLNASSAQLGVSNVELVLTDDEGTPLGSTDTLPIRSVQVSQVIWVILGTGVALLFGAIVVRLVRRVRRARAA